MFNIYTLDKGRLVRIQPEEIAVRKPIWVDVIATGEDEREWVDKAFSIILPQPEHLRDIEASARFYEEDDELHLRSNFLLGKESDSRSVIVAFVLANNVLFSVHDEDLPVFQRFRMRSHVQPDLVTDFHDVLIDLYGSDVEFSADALEEAYADLGGTSGTVLNNTLSDKDAAMVLPSIAHAEHLNGRTRRIPVRQDQLPDEYHGRFHQYQPEQDCAPVLGGGGGAAAAHAGRLSLRDEFQAHAGAGMGQRLSLCVVFDGLIRRGAALGILAKGLAEIEHCRVWRVSMRQNYTAVS